MADMECQPCEVCQFLKFDLPEFDSASVAATPVTGDHNVLCVGITFFSHQMPPIPDAFDGEFRSVGTYADTDEPLVGPDIIDAIGDGMIGTEIMIVDQSGFILPAVFRTCIFGPITK